MSKPRTLKKIPLSSNVPEMPREHLARVGAANIADEELLAVLLRTGNTQQSVLTLSRQLLAKHPLATWSERSLKDWQQIPGINLAKAATIVAAIELGERALSRKAGGPSRITKPESSLPFLAHIRNQKQEHLVALYLNARLQVIHQETLFIGTVDASLTHPREVFSPAIEHSAIAVIIAHNHPSGNTSPSQQDITVTRQLLAGAQMLQITLLDHIIVTHNSFVSLRQMGVIQEWKTDVSSRVGSVARDQEQENLSLTQRQLGRDNSLSYAVIANWSLPEE